MCDLWMFLPEKGKIYIVIPRILAITEIRRMENTWFL
jgi:hypothetical protein